ncbi:MAG TPA: hypothetical protein VJ975_11685 [Candidatus Limnocylindria bacterium]|nr:hypothetical protein [Candidatus Limnocylindria bacterium]
MQAVAHVRARVDPAEEGVARRVLPDGAFALYRAMPVADRRHALDVVDKLLAAGHDDTDVLAAALLHDVAKGDRMRLWHRSASVVLEAVAPRLLRRLAAEDPRSWRHPFHLYLHHDRLSARLADEAGCAPRVGAFIIGAVDGADARLLAALKEADDAS